MIEKIIIIPISQMFLREYMCWEDEQIDLFDNEEKITESIRYRQKVNGTGISHKEQEKDIKQWLFEKIEENVKFIDYD